RPSPDARAADHRSAARGTRHRGGDCRIHLSWCRCGADAGRARERPRASREAAGRGRRGESGRTMAVMDNVIDFVNVNRDRYLDELKALLAIPSISALPEHAPDVRRCAEWCADEMRRI